MLNVKLTAEGRAKILALDKKIEGFAGELLRSGIRDCIKPEIVSRTPDLNEEGKLLSKGIITGGGKYPQGEVGIQEGGRFLKQDYLSVQNAIRAEKVEVEKTGTLVIGKFGNTRRINSRAGFWWRVASGGMRKTLPFNHRLIQAMEHGGTWNVRPRTNKYLHPEPGVKAERMRKTIKPVGMFRNGAHAGMGKLRKYIMDGIENAARGIQ